MKDLEELKRINNLPEEEYLVDYPKTYEFPDTFGTLKEAEEWASVKQTETRIYKRIK
jgi:hypothetical protein